MSAQLAPHPARQSKPKPNLRALEAPKPRASNMPFVVVMAAILAIGMVGMVVLATALQGQAFAVRDKQQEANALANRVSQLESQVADARSVRNLAITAQSLGMRPNPYAVPMRLSDGKVLGTPRVVIGNEVPEARHLSDAEAAAQIAAYNQAEANRIAKLKAAADAKAAAEAAKKAEATANQAGTEQ